MANMVRNSTFWLTLGGISTISSLYMARGLAVDGLMSLNKPGGVWRMLALVFALLNLKSLPFGWHLRVLRGLLTHVSLSRHYQPPSPGPSALFQPVITSTRTSLLETDYNMHKSNSTYFSDLDISRMHHVACLFKRGLHKAHYNPTKNPDGSRKGKLGVMLGGVTCSFKKEIKPFESYEIWTRVLCWDRKWLYLISHIVKQGAVIPKGYTLQPHRKASRASQREPAVKSNGNGTAGTPQIPHPAIFATSIAKYVFKEGRITIPPELALEASELLPPKPLENTALERTKSPTGEGSAIESAVIDALVSVEPGGKLESKTAVEKEKWDWNKVEKERARGMLIAQHMEDLEQLHWEFSGDNTPALGRY